MLRVAADFRLEDVDTFDILSTYTSTYTCMYCQYVGLNMPPNYPVYVNSLWHTHTHAIQGPEIVVPLSSETVIAGRSIQLKCEIKSCVHPAPSITWLHDGIPLSIDRAFTNCGEKMCVLKINDVQRSDEGQYTCNISNKMGLVTSTATLTVLSK